MCKAHPHISLEINFQLFPILLIPPNICVYSTVNFNHKRNEILLTIVSYTEREIENFIYWQLNSFHGYEKTWEINKRKIKIKHIKQRCYSPSATCYPWL